MNEIDPVIFNPQNAVFSSTIVYGILFSLVFIILLIYLSRKKNPDNAKYLSLFQLMTGLLLLLSIGTIFMTFLSQDQMSDVELHSDVIKYANRSIDIDQISNAYIHQEKEVSPLNAMIVRDTSYFLIIEEIDGSTHLFPEDHYNILEMVKAIRSRMKK